MALSVYTRTRHFDKASLAWPSIFVLRVDVLDGYADHLEEELISSREQRIAASLLATRNLCILTMVL